MKKIIPLICMLISTPCFAQTVSNPFTSGNIANTVPSVQTSIPTQSSSVSHQRNVNIPSTETGSSCVKVWMNESSHVYHMQESKWYGKTKNGKYECEAQAISEGGRKSRSD